MSDLQHAITGLARRPGIILAALVSSEGLVIEQRPSDAADPETVAAHVATLERHAAQLGQAIKRGPFQAGILEYGSGLAVISRAGDDNLAVVVTEPEADVGAILHDLRRHEAALADLL